MPRPPHIERLVWDDWNCSHLTKHEVLPEEAEEVVAGEPASRETYKSRLLVVGPTTSGRMLAIVIGPVPEQRGRYYVFSARPASRKERAAYTQQKGGSP
ncbi:MAG: hypothetical protein M3Q71_25195 [Chloroflexota bacterium]|nr:hypothetical protein [Chloroflexota bacterium]